jgi:hypothetical protein
MPIGPVVQAGPSNPLSAVVANVRQRIADQDGRVSLDVTAPVCDLCFDLI